MTETATSDGAFKRDHGLRYRREIDGLRSLAVLSVILFHAGFGWISGGYIGVDIFFVISGYLITTIILNEKAEGRFTLAEFYERRARRILPALFVVLFACLALGWCLMLPTQFDSMSQSVAAVCGFVSNLLFWRQSGYFDKASLEKPLLHTWTLAVEEQYYLVFPLLIILLWPFGRKAIAACLVAIALLSLGVSEWGWRYHPVGNFFLTPSRAWELMIGALAAFHLTGRPYVYRRSDEALGALGLLLILYAMFAYTLRTPFPSLYALAPTVGAALIILFASSRTWVGRLLGLPPLVGIGLISYSAYLWHQPLFAFARLALLTMPSPGLMAGLVAASLVAGYLSWRFVERPFRNRRHLTRRAVFGWSFALSALFFAAGLAGHFAKGFPVRFPPALARIDQASTDKNPRQHDCLSSDDRMIAPEQSCRLGDAGAAPDIVLFGDSHADALFAAVDGLLKERQQAGLFMGYAGCPPITGLRRLYVSQRSRCAAFSDRAYAYLDSHPQIKTVIVASRWPEYLEGTLYDNGEGGIETGDAPPVAPPGGDGRWERDEPARRAAVAAAFTAGIRRLAASGKTIILIYPIPETGWVVPEYLAKIVRAGGTLTPATGSVSDERFKVRTASSYRTLDAAGTPPNLLRLYPERALCTAAVPGRCIVQLDGQPLYYDDNHLDTAGAALIARQLAGVLPKEK